MLDGHSAPSSGTRNLNKTGPAVELSAAQHPSNNIVPKNLKVNPYEKRSFIDWRMRKKCERCDQYP